VQNELKRTQNEPQLSAKMRALRVKFECSSTAQALAEASNGKDGRGRNRHAGGIRRTAREYENRGNKAKEYLKTKDITFLKVANFCAQINSNLTPKGANDATFCENEVRTCDSQRDGMRATSSRLDKLGTSIDADLISGRVAASYRRIVVCALPLTRGSSCDRPFPLSREWGCQSPREAGWKSPRWRGNGVEDKKRY
jgi:hypothetical protein